jgi:hypothetical protein
MTRVTNAAEGKNSPPKPTPQWPDITKPDTRGGNGPKK